MIDFRKELVYKANTAPAIVEVPDMLFVMVDGGGMPESTGGSTEFQRAMAILLGITYAIKLWNKKHIPPAGFDTFSLAPVEGLWWTKSGRTCDARNPDDWQWTVMLRLPEFVTPEFFGMVVAELAARKHTDMYGNARLERFREGACVQLLHIGPYDKEAADIEKMAAFARQNGYEVTDKHHELYFSDPRRTEPEALRTILRCPVRKSL